MILRVESAKLSVSKRMLSPGFICLTVSVTLAFDHLGGGSGTFLSITTGDLLEDQVV
jgi:hypothetical protein